MQETQAKVSILIPAYNVEQFIEQCLSSVLSQTYREIEVIVVNDGSKDNTLSICRRFEKADARVIVLDQPNAGVASARNRALETASGEYILFIDADDWIEKDMVETMINVFHNTKDVDIIFCNIDHANCPDEVDRARDSHKQELWDRDRQVYEFLRHRKLTGSLVTKMIRRNLCDGIWFDAEVGYGEDAQWLWRVLNRVEKMAVIDETFYHYVMEDQSISHLQYSSKKFSSIKVWKEIESEVFQKYPHWKSSVQERLLSSATTLSYEMAKSTNKNRKEKRVLRNVVRKNLSVLLKKNELSTKMKLYALAVAAGF